MILKFSKILTPVIGIIFSVWTQSSLIAQDSSLLYEADSLFENKKYTEALERYQEIYEAETSSPSMLMKMAFIHEGLGQNVEALYYLHQYYELTADREVINKITQLAETYELRGFEFNDTDYILNFIYRHETLIQLLLASLLLLTVVLIWRQVKSQKTPIGPIAAQVVIAVLLAISINHMLESRYAIIQTGNTVIMTDPSAGASPVTVIDKGHKVRILDQDDIWTKISYGELIGYVRTNRVLSI